MMYGFFCVCITIGTVRGQYMANAVKVFVEGYVTCLKLNYNRCLFMIEGLD